MKINPAKNRVTKPKATTITKAQVKGAIGPSIFFMKVAIAARKGKKSTEEEAIRMAPANMPIWWLR